MSRTYPKSVKYIAAFIVLLLTLIVGSAKTQAAPFFKCPDGQTVVSRVTTYSGKQLPGFTCSDNVTRPQHRGSAAAGFANARVRCPQGTRLWNSVVPYGWVSYCLPNTDEFGDGGGGPGDPATQPPTSYEANPTPSAGPPPGGGNQDNDNFNNPDRERNLNCGSEENCLRQNSLVQLLRRSVRFFTVIVGVVITAVIVWAGFTYARAGGDPSTTAEAKNRIKNAIIALVVFIFLGAIMNWAIPGGLF